MSIELGTIYTLPLKKKLPNVNLLIFDIGGESGRLHISQLSNNKELSQKMFDLFEVGEEVTVMVNDINKEKDYVELSTKAFRNYLDDSLSFTKCCELIQREYNEYADLNNRHLTQYRNILNRLRGDLSSTGLTFLYELLQNAVDHPNTNFDNKVSVHFEVFNNYLLLKHNGALFTENNFKSITGILYGEEQNEGNVRRIGYKGIGFKSVFRHSNNVYVRSGNFSFAFSKELTGAEKPWEVMPVFQDERDKIQEIPQFEFFNSPVAFAFEFPNDESKEDVINYLKELAKNPYLLIFLDNLVELIITLPDDGFRFEKEFLKDDDIDIIRLKDSAGQNSDWVKFSDQYEIKDEEIIAELTNESNTSIPSNFRQFRNPKIEVVIPKEPEQNLINLFTYLPLSRTQYELPFIINSDFIPNLDRTDIIDSLNYNRKVIEYAGLELLNSCQSLGQQGKFELQKALIPNYDEGNIPYKNIIRQTFIEKINQYVLFPSQYGDTLINLEGVVLDSTGMQNLLSKEQFASLIIPNHKPIASSYGDTKIVSFLIETTGKGKTYTIDDLKESIQKEAFQEWLKVPENNAKLINHLNSSDDLKPLLKESIILTNQNNLKKANEIYEKAPDSLSGFNPETIHSEILKKLEKEVKLNFKKYKTEEWFENVVLVNPVDSEDNIDANRLKTHWNWIFDEWNNLKENNQIILKLKSKKILCKNDQFNPLNNSYVSEEYQTDAIESIVNELNVENAHFISESLISEKRTKGNWLKIFKKLNAKADLEDVLSEVINNLSQYEDDKHFRIGQEVFKYWKKNKDNEEKKLSVHQITLLKQNLKIKCSDDMFRQTNACILSDHFNNDSRQSNILPSISLPNRISLEYEQNSNNVSLWKTFFESILKCSVLSENQEVFEEKINFFIEGQSQDVMFENHFKILSELAILFFDKKNNNINFKSKLFSDILLKGEDSVWRKSKELHLSSPFCTDEDLDLQKDDSVSGVHFISNDYTKKEFSRRFFILLGVSNTFSINISDYRYEECPDQELARRMWNSQNFSNRLNYLRQRYSDEQIKGRTSIENYLTCAYLQILEDENYHDNFCQFLINNAKNEKLFAKTQFVNNGTLYSLEDNNIIKYLNENKILKNLNGDRKKTTEMYSNNFEEYLDKSMVVESRWGEITIGDSDVTLEEAFGVQQEINSHVALGLISGNEPRLSKEDVEILDLTNILSNAELEDDKTYFLPNANYTWKPVKNLFMADEGFEHNLSTSNRLHNDFKGLAEVFRIEELSEQNLVVKTIDENNVSKEVEDFFQETAKFLACKLNKGYDDLEEAEAKILEDIKIHLFYECVKIDYVFPEENPIYEKSIDFYHNEEVIKFTGYWKQNEKLRQFLYELLGGEQLPQTWFDNLISRWDENEIISKLEDDFGQSPWNQSKNEESEPQRNFIQEVEDYIDNHLKEVEDIYDDDRITELKNILQNFSNHARGKQKAFNMLAKLKLCKNLRIDFDNNWDFNEVNNGEVKYLIHSARGAFAYIHPNEILRMRDEGFKIAIDYGRLDIRIYETADEIISLYQNYLMLYQSPENTHDIMKICEESTSRSKFHFLIVDREKQTDDVKAILKLMNVQNYE